MSRQSNNPGNLRLKKALCGWPAAQYLPIKNPPEETCHYVSVFNMNTLTAMIASMEAGEERAQILSDVWFWVQAVAAPSGLTLITHAVGTAPKVDEFLESVAIEVERERDHFVKMLREQSNPETISDATMPEARPVAQNVA